MIIKLERAAGHWVKLIVRRDPSTKIEVTNARMRMAIEATLIAGWPDGRKILEKAMQDLPT
jgi:hypothetical protein